MNPIREMLREHQIATDTSDGEILNILCTYMGTGESMSLSALETYVVDHLERLSGDLDVVDTSLPRHDPRFTDQDKQQMWEGALEEGNDLGRKEIAELVLDSWDLVSCIAASSVIDGNHVCEPLAEMLQRIDNKGDEEHITGEFLREHDDEDGYPAMLDFAKRMGMLSDDEMTVTNLGIAYIAHV